MLYVAALSIIAAGQNYVTHARNEGRKMTEWEFQKAHDRCETKCYMTCGSGDRDFILDAWQPNKFFLERCMNNCGVDASYCDNDPESRSGTRGVCYHNPVVQKFQEKNQGRYSHSDCVQARATCHTACEAECKRQFDSLTLCQPAKGDENLYITEKQARHDYGLDFCKFMAEVALGPRYRKPVDNVHYLYRHGSVVPKTGIKRDDPFWGYLHCDSSNNCLLNKQNVSLLIEEALDEWFYQPCREEDGCAVPTPEAADPIGDHQRFLTMGIGKTCRDFVAQQDEEQEDCGGQCRTFCYEACACHFHPDRHAAYLDGRGSEYKWLNKQGQFYCYERQKDGSNKWV